MDCFWQRSTTAGKGFVASWACFQVSPPNSGPEANMPRHALAVLSLVPPGLEAVFFLEGRLFGNPFAAVAQPPVRCNKRLFLIKRETCS